MSRRPNSARALRNSCGGVETLRATASQCFSSGCGGTNTSIWAVFGWPLASRIGVPLHVTLPVAVRCRPHLARRSATPPGVHRIWHGILSNARDCETGVAKVLTCGHRGWHRWDIPWTRTTARHCPVHCDGWDVGGGEHAACTCRQCTRLLAFPSRKAARPAGLALPD